MNNQKNVAKKQFDGMSSDEICQIDSMYQKQGKYQNARMTHEAYSQNVRINGMTELQFIEMLKKKHSQKD